MSHLTPQAKQIAKHLEAVGSITAIEAHALYRCRSLSRRITEVVDAGYAVFKHHKRDHTGQRYVRYQLKGIPV